MIRRLLHLLTPRTRSRLKWLIAANLVVAALDTIGVLLTLPLVSVLTGGSTAPELFGLELPAASTPLRTAGMLGGALIAVFVLRGALSVLLLRHSVRILHRDCTALQERIMTGYLCAPAEAQGPWSPTRLQMLIAGFIPQVIGGTMTQLLAATGDVLSALGILGVLLFTQPLPSVIAAAALAASATLFRHIIRLRQVAAAEGAARLHTPFARAVLEPAQAARLVRLRGAEHHFVRRIISLRERGLGFDTTLQTIGYGQRYFIEVVFLLVAAAVGVTSALIGGEEDALPTVGLFIVGGFRLLPSVQRFLSLSNGMRNGEPLVSEIEGALDALEAPAEQVQTVGQVITDVPCIELKGVTFRYPDSDRPALRDVSLVIERGTFVGFVGASGAGKSTLADVVMGLLDPTAGVVEVGGTELAAVRRAWQLQIGYVPQEIALAEETITETVAFGCEPGDISRESVWAALERARLDEVVRALPHGIDTLLSTGRSLSGGERQRLALARALYPGPRLLILDEATSQLDGIAEAAITDLIHSLKGDMTIIAIAHRLSTIRECDVVHFIEAGQLVGSGTFESLRAELPAFEHLVELSMTTDPTAESM